MERSVANFNTIPRGAAKIYTLSFQYQIQQGREVKLNGKGDSYLWFCLLLYPRYPLKITPTNRCSIYEDACSQRTFRRIHRLQADYCLSSLWRVGKDLKMGKFELTFVSDLFCHTKLVFCIFLRSSRPLLLTFAQTFGKILSIISPTTKPMNAPRTVAQNQGQLKVIPTSFILVPLLSWNERKNVKMD